MSLFGFPLLPLDAEFTSNNHLICFLKSLPLKGWKFEQLAKRLNTTNIAKKEHAVPGNRSSYSALLWGYSVNAPHKEMM